MTLDSILAEVGPILGSSGQFSHPSFGEVLAARQFAEEINSGRLSASDAYVNLWSSIDASHTNDLCPDFRVISSQCRSSMNFLSPMLTDKAAREFIQVISNSYFLSAEQIDFSSPTEFYDSILEDLSFCAKVIGDHPSLHTEIIHEKIIYALERVVHDCFMGEGTILFDQKRRSDAAKRSLIETKSSYASLRLLAYVRWLGSILDQNHPANYLLRSNCRALSSFVKKGAKVGDDALLNLVCDLENVNEMDVFLILEHGGIKSCKRVLNVLSEGDNLSRFFDSSKRAPFENFIYIFDQIEKYEFMPELIDAFNEVVSIPTNEYWDPEYHIALRSFARNFKERFGIEFYEHLEKKGVQFLDSWVYKPK